MQKIVILLFALCSVALSADEKPPRFSIGLGVLAPSYSQKFDGNGRLDVDQDKNGFSYSLNNPHSSTYQSQSNPAQYQSAQSPSSGSDYSSPQGQFSIYQHRSIPKQVQSQAYQSPSEDYSGPQQSLPQQQSYRSPQMPQQYQQYSSPVSSGQSYNEPQPTYNSEPDYNSEGQGANIQQSGPRFAPFNFEQQITHQVQEHSPFQSQPQYQSQGPQSYESQPQSYQSQPSHQRYVRLQQQPIQSQQPLQYKPTQAIYSRV